MNYLLDTSVISEPLRPRPNRNVLRWLETVAEVRFYLSVLTLGELRKGVELLPSGRRKERMRDWLHADLPARFEGRILGVDARVCDRWGYLQAERKRLIPAVDSLLAATALTHELTVLTHNTKDFDFRELRVIDPFVAGAPS